MDMGRRTTKRLRKDKTDVNRRTMDSILCERRRQRSNKDANTSGLGITLWQQQDEGNER